MAHVNHFTPTSTRSKNILFDLIQLLFSADLEGDMQVWKVGKYRNRKDANRDEKGKLCVNPIIFFYFYTSFGYH